jgi:HD-GYP domain-containing protein (c-di-GMP phosphodiesterase class II)
VSDARSEKIQATDLSVGMFVSELDRPWLGTPFLLEGVLIEEQAQIDTMISLCEFVYIDRALSVGTFHAGSNTTTSYANHINNAVPSRNVVNISPANEKKSQPEPAKDSFSFFDVLKEIKNSKQNKTSLNPNNLSSSQTIFNIQRASNSETATAPMEDQASLVSLIKQDVSDLLGGFGHKNNHAVTKDKATILAEHLAKKQTKNLKELNPVEKEIVQAYPVYEKTQIATRQVFEALANDKHIDLSNVHEAVDGMVDSIERNPDALMWLAKLKQSDNDAYNHAMNVSITMMALANFMSLPKKQVKDLGMAGLLQDIGKSKIDFSIMRKTGKVTPEEFEAIKKHVDYATNVLKVTENIPNHVIQTVSQHHERIDGSGYPQKLAGKEISLTGQLAGLVDTYCALTTDRAYAKGVFNQRALEVIHQLRDQKFSGVLIDQLVQFLGMYPVTSLVELNTGEVGVVIEQNSVRRLLPRILILLNPDKSKNTFPTTINLINSPLTPSGAPYAIVRGLPPDSYGLNPNTYYA